MINTINIPVRVSSLVELLAVLFEAIILSTLPASTGFAKYCLVLLRKLLRSLDYLYTLYP